MSRTLAALLLATLPAAGLAFDGPVERCRTTAPDPETRALLRQQLDEWVALRGTEMADREIPVAFHVIHTNSKGDLSQREIEDQIEVLNDAFVGSGFSFALQSVDWKKKGSWYRKCDRISKERQMKSELAIDPATTLNVYSCGPKNLLGYALLPWDEAEDSFWHGVVIHHDSLPGGQRPFDEGDTLVHEIGHYLGLYHTFDGGCSGPGDEVDDTPAEKRPNYGCPASRDTCPSAGNDPIHNFMDYSDDVCLDRFTSGQVTRMERLTDLYRPRLGS